MANRNITSADVAARLVCADLFPQGFDLENFGTDAAIVAETATELETRMSIDGHLSAGFTPVPKVVTLTFQPTSPSLEYIDQITKAQRADLTPYELSMVVNVKATGKEFRFSGGFISQSTPMPAIQKTIQEVTLQITFEKVE